LWEHSLSCAYASQLVTDTLSLKFEEDAFTMGLLHDIGKLILAQVVGEMENRAQPEDEISEQSLFDVLNAYHGKTGAALLSRWGFSRVFTDVALYHDDIESAGEIAKELNVVCLANLLVKTMGYGQKEPLEINLIETESARALGLDTSNIVEIEKKVRQQIDELKQLLE
jgi:putative nucleotidyltransferase with HDIG domain